MLKNYHKIFKKRMFIIRIDEKKITNMHDKFRKKNVQNSNREEKKFSVYSFKTKHNIKRVLMRMNSKNTQKQLPIFV